jgi:nucleoside-diphosphate-sugar epimerase
VSSSKSNITRALVTGGAGFIGLHLVEHLRREGIAVRVLDNFSAQFSKPSLSFADANLEWIEGDIRTLSVVEGAADGCNWIFHLAAMNSIPRSIAEPALSHAVNVDGTLNVLTAARKAGVTRVIFASSSSVYGDTASEVRVESMPVNPLAPYPLQKLTGECYARMFHSLYGLETVSLRFFNIFGPRQPAESAYAAVIPRFCSAMLQSRSPAVFGDGRQTRDFTYVSNVTSACLTVARAPIASVGGKVFNVGNGCAVTLLELVAGLNDLLGANIQPQFAAKRPGEVYRTQADISALRALGWTPTVSFKEGLRHVVDWWRTHPAGLSRVGDNV